MSELRWNPILEEWVVTATHRQDRTYRPPEGFCPLCPTHDAESPTEVPLPGYEIVVFENKFPSFRRAPGQPAVQGTDLQPVAPPVGVCEVVLYTDDHHATFADLPVERITNLVDVWTDRYEELGALECVDYVLIFENKGDAVGVTLSHPHGQIYGFPFVPPRAAKELESAERHLADTGRCLFCDLLSDELTDGRRMVAENAHFAAFIPFFARYPYEVHVMPKQHRTCLPELDASERRGFAEILKAVTSGYDSLFGFSLPYIMVIHQAPTDRGEHSSSGTECDSDGVCVTGSHYGHYHMHVEFYPPHRTANKVKYLAGCESGAGTFINDTLPEEKAVELREAVARAAAQARSGSGGGGINGHRA
ncbi:MAG: galactose-1-phosphate uridylyltransferase [Clostridia bacterium]|nr:galactose-1-phosphate uridylyltransferase [Clostridia bacterium]